MSEEVKEQEVVEQPAPAIEEQPKQEDSKESQEAEKLLAEAAKPAEGGPDADAGVPV